MVEVKQTALTSLYQEVSAPRCLDASRLPIPGISPRMEIDTPQEEVRRRWLVEEGGPGLPCVARVMIGSPAHVGRS